MYQADEKRYETMKYHRCGASGLMLPELSLGLWHNFGDTGVYENMKEILFTAFDNGIVHFDLANNYGPAYGSAEKNFGKILKEELGVYRDELLISTKAGFDMWEGPYGNWGSRKYLLSSLDQSLKRMGLDYVDIFYHHRMDPETPLEETMGALASAVQSGKALYVGLSNYDGPTLEKAEAILRDLKCPFVINQNRYSIFDRTIEKNGLKDTAKKLEKGIIAFSPLAQGKHYHSRGTGVRTLADIYVMEQKLGKTLNWEYVESELRDLDIFDYEKDSRQLAKKLFGAAEWLQEDLLTEAEQKMLAYYVGSSTYGTIQTKMQNLQSDGKAITVYTKLRYIFSRIFPDLKWCKFYAPTVYKYPVLLPFFWVWRLLVKGFKKRNIVKCELESIKNAK